MLDKKAYAHAYYIAHKERWPAYTRAYRIAHPATELQKEEAAARTRAWYRANRERALKNKKAYKQNHREERNAWNRAWGRTHRAQTQILTARRRARKRALPSTLTTEQWKAIKVAYHQRCAYCGERFKRLTQDHVIPLMRGGGTTPDNIVPACQSCNSKKRDGSPPTLPALRLLL